MDNRDSANRSEVLGVPCFIGEPTEAAHKVVCAARNRRGGYVCLCNVHVLVTAQHDQALARALSAASLNLPDGAPVAWLQRRLGARDARRVGGPDLMPLVLSSGRKHNLRHFLFGSTPQVLDRLTERLKADFPGVTIVGELSPPFGSWSPDTEVAVLKAVTAAKPDIVWCALGAPKQELWMRKNAPALRPAVVIGVGAAFDFLAGAKPRAPKWMQRWGLEWLHRLSVEPRRLAGRYFRTNIEYIFRALAAIGRSRVDP